MKSPATGTHSPDQKIVLPRLYPIVDAANFAGTVDPTNALVRFTRELLAGGAKLIQYRNKKGSGRDILGQARELRNVCGRAVQLIVNDRADLCVLSNADGVHLGQDDLSARAARVVVGERLWVGVSTHSVEQVRAADAGPADYVAIGPVFATATKENPDPVVGLEGVRAARASTRKPLVAIGGITSENCRSVIEAGADSVAVISALLDSPGKTVEQFIRILG